MKIIGLFGLLLILQSVAQGQPTKDSLKNGRYEYITLRFESVFPEKNLYVFLNDTQEVNLKEKLNIKRNNDKDISYDNTLVTTGINFLDKQGYELVSSLAYGDFSSNYVKEYIFRRKKKTSH